MPNGQQQQPQQERKWWAYNAYVYTTSFLKRLPIVKRFGFRRRTAITKEGKLKEPQIVKQELRPLFELNKRLIGELRTIEDRWKTVDAIIEGGPQLPEGLYPLIGDIAKGTPGFYSDLGHYTNPTLLALETDYFQYGANVSMSDGRVDVNSVIQDIRNRIDEGDRAAFDSVVRSLTPRDMEEIREASTYIRVDLNGGEVTNEELRTSSTPEEIERYARFVFDYEVAERRQAGEVIANENEFLNQIREEERLRILGTEKLYPFGWQKIEGIKARFEAFGTRWGQTATRAPAIDVDVRNARERLFRDVTQLLDLIGKIEKEHFDHLAKVNPYLDRFRTTRTRLLTIVPERVRFKHTYMVIKPFITVETREMVPMAEVVGQEQVTDEEGRPRLDEEGNPIMRNIYREWEEEKVIKKAVYFDNRRNTDIPNNLRPRYLVGNREVRVDEWQRPSERNAGVPPGYDENGYPLEINERGEILLDKWWNEIARNPWQLETIAKKTGGREVLMKELGYVDVTVRVEDEGTDREKTVVAFVGTASRPIRKVDPRWADMNYGNPYIDLLEMAMYISNEYDTYRDDFRDGRYHPNSKTAVDYTIAAEGGFAVAPYFNKPKSWYREIPNVKKMYRRARSYNEFNPDSYILATPEYFESDLPFEEEEVTRKYKMKLSTGEIIDGERVPSHANPAFDLRAVNRDGSRVLWGRMLYYEWPEGVNKWSENPFPSISSRGIAQFLLDRILRDLYDYEDQKRTMIEFGEQGYDYGVRRPLLGGSKAKFPKDLVGGSDVVQAGEWF